MHMCMNSHKYLPRNDIDGTWYVPVSGNAFAERKFGLSGFYKDQKERETWKRGRDRNVDSFLKTPIWIPSLRFLFSPCMCQITHHFFRDASLHPRPQLHPPLKLDLNISNSPYCSFISFLALPERLKL